MLDSTLIQQHFTPPGYKLLKFSIAGPYRIYIYISLHIFARIAIFNSNWSRGTRFQREFPPLCNLLKKSMTTINFIKSHFCACFYLIQPAII